MQISEDQIKKYIEIQKKVRSITLTQEEAIKEASSLLIFAKAVVMNLNIPKKTKKPLKNN